MCPLPACDPPSHLPLAWLQLRQLEMQWEQECDEKQALLREKRDLESLVATLCEQVREGQLPASSTGVLRLAQPWQRHPEATHSAGQLQKRTRQQQAWVASGGPLSPCRREPPPTELTENALGLLRFLLDLLLHQVVEAFA